MAELTVYSTAADSYVESVNATWATMCAGSSLSAAAAGTEYIGYANDYGDELFLAFDTSAIAVGSTITGVTFQTTTGMVAETHVQECYAYDWGASIGTDDWRTGNTSGWLATEYSASHRLAYVNITTGDGWDTARPWTVGAAMNAAIVCEGTTRLVLASDSLRGASAVNNTRLQWHSGADATQANRPKLVITYSPPVGFTGLTVTRLLNG
jgi:hypothetical protein